MAVENGIETEEFTLQKKAKMIVTEVYDKTPYIKKGHAYVPEDQMKGKKFGGTYTVYRPDPGKSRVVSKDDGKNGLKAKIDNVQEVPYVISMKAGMNDVELDEWNKLCDIESFKNEIVKVRALNLARTIEKDAIDSTIWEAAQVGYIGALDLDAIGLGSAGLDEASVAGDRVTFINPKIGAKLAKKALGSFLQQEKAKELYNDKYLGTYAETQVVTESLMPVVVADSSRTATITLVEVSDATGEKVIGFEPVVKLKNGSTAKEGDVFTVSGLKLVDVNGIQTNTDYHIVVGKNGSIPELRITLEGENCNNANAWMPKATSAGDKAGTYALTNGKTYDVVQTRTQSALGYDAYEFGKIPGTEMSKESIDGVSIQVYEGGNLGEFSSLVRMVVPFACGIPDARACVLSYIER